MKKSRFTEAQIVAVLHDGDAGAIPKRNDLATSEPDGRGYSLVLDSKGSTSDIRDLISVRVRFRTDRRVPIVSSNRPEPVS